MTDHIPMPRASPQPPKHSDGDTSPGIATTGYTKQKLRKYATRTGGVGALVVAAMTWWFETRAAEAKKQAQQVDTTSFERMVKVEQRLADHIDAENQRHTEVLERLSRGERLTSTIDAKMDLELDQHHVPRARRPKLEDFEPAGPPGEQK